MTSVLAHSPGSTGTLDASGLAPLHPHLPHIVMYTLPTCPKCDRLKVLFKAAKLPVVAVAIDTEVDAYTLFHDELQVKETPVVLVHNTFQEPAYFSGFDSDRTRIVINAVFARLEALAESGELTSIEHYLADLAAGVESSSRPFIRPEAFAAMAEGHLHWNGVQSPRITSPTLLPKFRSESPVILR